MKTDYKEIFHIVKNVVEKNDPLSLLNAGSPKDEYDEEVQRIVSGLMQCKDTAGIQKLIYGIFLESFGAEAAGNINRYLNVAKEISLALKK